MKKLALALMAVGSPIAAHDFHEMKITQVSEKSVFTSIVLSDTVQGVRISCALFNAEGAAIAQGMAITQNLATEVLIQTPAEAVASARCVEN